MRIGISGARGVVGSGLGPADVARLCDSFCEASGASKCALGMDTRESGPILKAAAAASLTQNGLDVLDYGVAPTPVIFRESRRAGAGIVVTASHNPPEWNGLKFVLAGRGIDASTLSGSAVEPRAHHGSIGSQAPALSSYVEEAAALVGAAPGRMSVALDAGGGAALETARALLERIGCEVRVVDSSRGPDPTADDLGQLMEASADCDLGLAFDLDGDRVVLARRGKIQTPDATLAIGIAWALDRGCRSFAVSEDTSLGIAEMIAKGGGRMTETQVGENNVAAAMDQNACGAGGEGSSAGFILPEFNYCRDGILTGAISAVMAASGRLDAALEAVSGRHQLRQKVAAPADLHQSIIEKTLGEIRPGFARAGGLGGFKGTVDDSTWVLIRGSNTEDAIRVSAESGSEEGVRGLADRVCEAVGRHVGAHK